MVDLVEKKYGRLTVFQKSDLKANNRESKWLCKCDCGNATAVAGSQLKLGRTQSCGCLRSEKLRQLPPPKPRYRDLTGMRFGRLVAVRRLVSKPDSGRTLWECRCDCGGSISVVIDSLVCGRTKSCGCLAKENDSRLPEKIKKERVENTCLCLLTSKIRVDNTSGCKGVYWDKKRNRFEVYINFQKKRHYIGSSKDYSEAVRMREEAEQKYFVPILDKYATESQPDL